MWLRRMLSKEMHTRIERRLKDILLRDTEKASRVREHTKVKIIFMPIKNKK